MDRQPREAYRETHPGENAASETKNDKETKMHRETPEGSSSWTSVAKQSTTRAETSAVEMAAEEEDAKNEEREVQWT